MTSVSSKVRSLGVVCLVLMLRGLLGWLLRKGKTADHRGCDVIEGDGGQGRGRGDPLVNGR